MFGLEFATGERLDTEHHVVSFRGHEEISHGYALRVSLSGSVGRAANLERDLLGVRGCLRVHGGERSRSFHGLVRRVRLTGHDALTERVHYEAELVPRFWLLTQTRDSRIFQDQTVEQVVDAVLAPHGVARRWSLTRALQVRAYCVQHQESDHAFVARLLAEEGIFYFFEHPGADAAAHAAEVLVLADAAGGYAPLAEDGALPYQSDEGIGRRGEHVSAFALEHGLRAGSVRVEDRDFARPRLERAATSTGHLGAPALQPTALEQGLRVREHHGEFEGVEVDAPAAQRVLEQTRARRHVGRGAGNCPALAAGTAWTLEGHPIEPMNGRYVAVRVEHEGHHFEARGAVAVDGREGYRNRFQVVPAGVAYRPRRPRRRLQQALETATVVGPAGEDVHTDAHGRVRVQFHWDERRLGDERSSCWVRVAQTWAGSGWGTLFLPRVGMEVLVEFVGGDTDRPMVVGCVYNGERVPPFDLPVSKSRSGIVTRSTPGGAGHNELSFEDAAGSEQVRLRAQRNLDARVLHDYTLDVGHDRRERVAGDSEALVVGTRTLELGGDLRSTVGGRRVAQVALDDESVVRGGRRDVVGEHLSSAVEGNHAETIGGEHSAVVRGPQSVMVGSHSYLGVRGRRDVQVDGPSTADYHQGHAVRTTGEHQVHATQMLRLDAGAGIELRCGDSTIELRPDEIRISAPRVSVEGGERVRVRGGEAVLRLSGDAVLKAQRATLQSSGATLQLDADATLRGSHVRMLSAGGARASQGIGAQPSPTETRQWTVRVRVPDGRGLRNAEPLRNAHFRATGHGPEPYEGQTDGDGVLRIPVVHERCLIEVQFERHLLRLRAGDLEGVETDDGVRQRLYNLGYSSRPPDAWTRAEFAHVLRRFQREHGLEPTGTVNDAVRGALGGAP